MILFGFIITGGVGINVARLLISVVPSHGSTTTRSSMVSTHVNATAGWTLNQEKWESNFKLIAT